MTDPASALIGTGAGKRPKPVESAPSALRRERHEAAIDEVDGLHQPWGIKEGQGGSQMIMRAALFLFGVSLSLASAAPAQDVALDAASLAALDAEQKDMVAKGDIDGLAALASPDLKINAPTNRILTRDRFIALMRNGQIGAEAFERTVESATVSGNIGIVMGSEIFTPTADSQLGKTYGSRPLKRRYTNIYVVDAGRWRWLARHANVVPDGAPSTR